MQKTLLGAYAIPSSLAREAKDPRMGVCSRLPFLLHQIFIDPFVRRAGTVHKSFDGTCGNLFQLFLCLFFLFSLFLWETNHAILELLLSPLFFTGLEKFRIRLRCFRLSANHSRLG